jgi:hypothetical protein
MSTPAGTNLETADAVVMAAAEAGLLLLSDPKRRNAIQILTGEFPRGTWWSHPDANQIYRILQRVEAHPDLLSTKLLSGKVTFVHRSLWPALLAVVAASPREDWQVAGLSPGAAQWLAALDQAAASASEVVQPSRTIIKEIEARMLARGESVHTGQGRHETRVEPWTTWAARAKFAWPSAVSSDEGKAALEAAAEKLGPPPPSFPWNELPPR